MSSTITNEYANREENTMIVPTNVLIATGSKPKSLPGLEIDGKLVMSSDEALEMEELPASIVIVGGGVIGIEWASMLADFGVDVTVIEYADQILPTEDDAIAKEVEKLLKKKGITFVKGAKVLAETITKDNGVAIEAEINNKKEKIKAEKMMIIVGQEANTGNLGLQNTEIVVDKGFIRSEEHTSE